MTTIFPCKFCIQSFMRYKNYTFALEMAIFGVYVEISIYGDLQEKMENDCL